jgi:F0F1-type ATP synthase assembly protein I
VKRRNKEDEGRWAFLWRDAFRAINLGWELALPIFGGVLAGHYLDRWLGTGYTFTLGLLTLGVAAGFYNIWHFHRGMEAAEQQMKDKERAQEDQRSSAKKNGR